MNGAVGFHEVSATIQPGMLEAVEGLPRGDSHITTIVDQHTGPLRSTCEFEGGCPAIIRIVGNEAIRDCENAGDKTCKGNTPTSRAGARRVVEAVADEVNELGETGPHRVRLLPE